MLSGIYKISNTKSGDFYIGSSANIKKRMNKHFRELSLGCHPNIHMRNSYKKYGNKYFIWEVIEQTSERLIEKEQSYIDKLKPTFNKRKIAISNQGTTFGEQARANMSKAMTGSGNNFFGRKHSAETKDRMRLAKLGRKQSKGAILNRAKTLMKKIFQFTLDGNLVNVFNSIKDTATNNGFDKKWFSECRIIKKGLFKGFYWLTSKQAYAKGFKTNLSV